MKNVLVIENWEDRGADILRLTRTAGHSASMVRPYAREVLPAHAEFDAVVLSGGPMSIHDLGRPDYAFLVPVMKHVEGLLEGSVPCLGICLGHQILAVVLGGRVAAMATPDVGVRSIRRLGNDVVGRIERFQSFVFHRDQVVDVPPECVPTFTSDGCTVEGFRHPTQPIHGVQFHPEVPSARAIDLLARWRSEADGRLVIGDPVAFDGRDAHVVFNDILADLLAPGGAA